LPSRSETKGLEKVDEDGIVISVNLDKDAANADGLTVVTSQRDFEYNLQIHGSNDGQNWEKLVNNSAIYDYSRYMKVGNRDIELPANSYRQFKIVVAKASQTRTEEVLELTRTLHGEEELQRSEKTELHDEPLHIERIDFWHKHSETLPEAEQRFDYPVTVAKIGQDAEHKTTLIDIETRRQPLTGFTLKTTMPNFSRQAEVKIPFQQGMETRMQTLGGATLEALHFQDINRDQTSVTFPEQRQPKYQIVIRNQDNPPLEIDTVIGNGPGYRLLFLPQAGQSYQLRYGSDKAEPPRYDIAPIQELLRRGYQSTTAELGPETAVATGEHKPDFGELLNSKWFLGGAIGLMVLVLGWSLYRIGKRVEDLPK
ncbi:MAG: DUF3999 family protein, partial [Methylococcaceae bacterium]|nr:DUF3999 family protein [Methylococcaceae bacterium]